MAAKTPDSVSTLSMRSNKLTIGHFTTTPTDDNDTWDTGLGSVNSLEKTPIWTAQTSAGPNDFQVDGVSAGVLTFDCAASTNGHVYILSADY